MTKLKLSQNLLYVCLAPSLVLRLSAIYSLYAIYESFGEILDTFGYWYFIRIWVFPLLFLSSGLLFTYLRFQKNSLKANWGLLLVLLYIVITLGVRLVDEIRFFPPPFDVPYILSNYLFYYLSSFGIIYGVLLAVFKSEDLKKLNQPDELSEKEWLPTLILCFFFGFIGVHRFYVGKIGTGILMIFTLGGLGIWALIDFIMICTSSFKDREGRIIKYRTAVTAPQNSSSSEMGIAAEIEKFSELKDKGIISEEEFNKKKEQLLK
jgi:TM2 domain-containing membrane protein YozV